jgi:dihydroorotate dehydrogenase 2
MNRELLQLLKNDGFSSISEAIGADFNKKQKKSKKL